MATIPEREVVEPGVVTMSADELAGELSERVKALYRLNAELAAHVDRMRPVVDLAKLVAQCDRCDGSRHLDALQAAVLRYEREMAELAKEQCNGQN